MKISNEIKVGALTVIAVTLLILGYQFLRGKEIFKREAIYYAVYDRVDDLDVADPVTINGYHVGSVKSMMRKNDHMGKVVVSFSVQRSVKLYKSTVAVLTGASLLGARTLELKVGNQEDVQHPGDTLSTNIESGIQGQVEETLLPLKVKTEQLLNSVDTVITSIHHFLNDTTLSSVEEGINSVAPTLKNFARAAARIDSLVRTQTKKISALLVNLEVISDSLKQAMPDIKNSFANISAISDSLKRSHITQLVDEAQNTITEIDKTVAAINDQQGSIGKLVYDKKLYDNLTASSKRLEELLADLKAHPSRYVTFSIFGRGKRDSKKNGKDSIP